MGCALVTLVRMRSWWSFIALLVAQFLAAFFPMKWTFWFPIESLVGDMPPHRLLLGLGAQLLWILGLAVAVQVMWRRAVRRYTAVGN